MFAVYFQQIWRVELTVLEINFPVYKFFTLMLKIPDC